MPLCLIAISFSVIVSSGIVSKACRACMRGVEDVGTLGSVSASHGGNSDNRPRGSDNGALLLFPVLIQQGSSFYSALKYVGKR